MKRSTETAPSIPQYLNALMLQYLNTSMNACKHIYNFTIKIKYK